MFNSFISYLSRFSRHIFFAFTVVAVVFLATFAFDAIKDDPAPVEITEVMVTETTSSESANATLDSNDITVVATANESTQSSVVAVAGDSTGDERGHASATSSNTLPNAGAGEVLFVALALMGLSLVAIGYVKSRRNLAVELLDTNR